MPGPERLGGATDALVGRTIVIVDPHTVFADVIASSLRQVTGVSAVHQASGLSSAIALVRTVHPELVLVDYHLGRERGLDLIATINALGEHPDVIVLSESTQPREIVDAFAHGAVGWVAKSGWIQNVADAAAAAEDGDLYLAPKTVRPVIEALRSMLDVGTHQQSFLDRLTPREGEVLACLMQGMTRVEVAEELVVSTNTVRTHVQNLMRAADVHSTLALLAAARRAGKVQPLRPVTRPVPRQLPRNR